MNRIRSKESADDPLARHARKCAVCRHPEREAIEEEFLEWHSVFHIAEYYELNDERTIYRHARATGLLERRRENLRAALDGIVEHCHTSHVTADAVLRAIRAYSCLDSRGHWTSAPSRVIFTVERSAFPESSASAGLPPAAESCPAELAPETPRPLLSPAPDAGPLEGAPTEDAIPDSNAGNPDLIAVPRLEIPVSD